MPRVPLRSVWLYATGHCGAKKRVSSVFAKLEQPSKVRSTYLGHADVGLGLESLGNKDAFLGICKKLKYVCCAAYTG